MLGCIIDCHQFLERDCLCYSIAALTSDEDDTRAIGYYILSMFESIAADSRFREKTQVKRPLQILDFTASYQAYSVVIHY